MYGSPIYYSTLRLMNFISILYNVNCKMLEDTECSSDKKSYIEKLDIKKTLKRSKSKSQKQLEL